MTSLFATLIPLYGVIAAGWLAGRLGVMGQNAAQVLSRFVFLFAMPVAVFGFFAAAPPPDAQVLPMMAAYFIAAAIMMLVTGLAARRRYGLSVPETGAHAFVSTCGNAIFLGLPIALSIDGWGQPFLMLMLIEGTFVYGTSVLLFQWPEDDGAKVSRLLVQALGRTLRTPIVIATLSGLALSLLQTSLPPVLADFARFFGAAAAPTGLFVVGLYIAALPKAELGKYVDMIVMTGTAKLMLLPGLTFVLSGLFTGWNMTLVATATFFTSLPPAVSAVVQASHFGVYERRCAAALVTLTPLSLISVTVLLLVVAS